MKKTIIAFTLLLASCEYPAACYQTATNQCPEPTEPCHGIGSEPSGGETGDEPAECSLYTAPTYEGTWVHCGGKVSKGEHCYMSAVHNYGTTDYAFETANATYAVKFDFMPIGGEVNDPTEPGATWWTWSKNIFTAVPGVVTYEQAGVTWANYMSRGCCVQDVVEGFIDGPIANEECSKGGYSRNKTPDAYCIDMDDGSNVGLCVYPCSVPNDCPNPAGEFCDLSRPDPYGLAPGVCRYKSMPTIPTPLEEINN